MIQVAKATKVTKIMEDTYTFSFTLGRDDKVIEHVDTEIYVRGSDERLQLRLERRNYFEFEQNGTNERGVVLAEFNVKNVFDSHERNMDGTPFSIVLLATSGNIMTMIVEEIIIERARPLDMGDGRKHICTPDTCPDGSKQTLIPIPVELNGERYEMLRLSTEFSYAILYREKKVKYPRCAYNKCVEWDDLKIALIV